MSGFLGPWRRCTSQPPRCARESELSGIRALSRRVAILRQGVGPPVFKRLPGRLVAAVVACRHADHLRRNLNLAQLPRAMIGVTGFPPPLPARSPTKQQEPPPGQAAVLGWVLAVAVKVDDVPTRCRRRAETRFRRTVFGRCGSRPRTRPEHRPSCLGGPRFRRRRTRWGVRCARRCRRWPG